MASGKSDTLILAPGDVVGGRFTVIDQLGRGNLSTVYLAKSSVPGQHHEHQLVAIKVPKPNASTIKVSEFEGQLARKEIESLRRDQSEVDSGRSDAARAKLLMPDGAFEHESLERPILLFAELCGPSVHEFVQTFADRQMPWAMARQTIDDTLTAVHFLHERGVGHGGRCKKHTFDMC